MEPTRDNPLIRFKAFVDGIGVLTIPAVIILTVAAAYGVSAYFGFSTKTETPEDSAAEIRYKIQEELLAYEEELVTDEQIETSYTAATKLLLSTKAMAVNEPSQIVPGSPTAVKLASGDGPDVSEIDALAADPDAPIDPKQMEIGQQQYLVCGACHGQNGEGGPAGPPIAQSEWVTGPISNLILIQLRGLIGEITVNGKVYNYPAGMGAMSYQTDEQVAAVLTYIRNSFGNKASAVTPEQVLALRGEVGKPQIKVEELKQP